MGPLPAGKPELLAPAGSWESLIAAVQNGADAVYLGGKDFNARQSAKNFDRDQLADAVNFAHGRDVKIHVTINTLLADNELPSALDYVYFLAETGVDAVILQDIGLASLLHKLLPEMPLHASTQMTCHNTANVQYLQRLGFSRIILARETELKDIEQMRKETGSELEVFVHGALCICFSGQCLMSSMIGGRSGNRGRCAQPCRMAYTLTDMQGNSLASSDQCGRFLLSPRDLNMSAYMAELISAGISSFKIEGRMKRPEYVATVVRIYRSIIDRCLAAGTAEGHLPDEKILPSDQERKDLAQIFNRDFTQGYFFGDQGRELMSSKRPNNRGLLLGRVTAYDQSSGKASVKLEDDLHLGDGLEVWVSRGGRAGSIVKHMQIENSPGKCESAHRGQTVVLELSGHIHAGDRVFKTSDAALLERARRSFSSEKEADRLPLILQVEAAAGKPMRLTLTDAEGLSVSCETSSSARKAIKRPLTEEYLAHQLDRFGNTPFYVKKMLCHIDGDVMVPVSEINQCRREAVMKLMELRKIHFQQNRNLIPAAEYQQQSATFLYRQSLKKTGSEKKLPLISAKVSDLYSVRAAVQEGADIVYFGGISFNFKPVWNIDSITEACRYCIEKGAQPILSSPGTADNKETAAFMSALRSLIEKGREFMPDGVLAGNSGIGLVLRKNRNELGLKNLMADYSMNVFNLSSVRQLRNEGWKQITLSPELTMQQIKNISSASAADSAISKNSCQFAGLEIIVQGALPLMVSRHCVPGSVLGGKSYDNSCSKPCFGKMFGLKDRLNLIFPLACDQNCQMHIFNAQDLCMINEMHTLLSLPGIQCLRIEAETRDADYVRKTVKLYNQARHAFEKTGELPDNISAGEQLAALSPQGLTKGHYYRGVLGEPTISKRRNYE